MLILARSLRELNFGMLMEVYEEGNRENAGEFWPDLDPAEGLLQAEQDFYQYLKTVFFPVDGAVCAIWEEKGRYVSALRLEPYGDGLLLEGLETAPSARRKGYAENLILAVQDRFGEKKIYSHVHKGNIPSLKIHKKCGFQIICDHAVYIDGSVNSRCFTLCFRQP